MLCSGAKDHKNAQWCWIYWHRRCMQTDLNKEVLFLNTLLYMQIEYVIRNKYLIFIYYTFLSYIYMLDKKKFFRKICRFPLDGQRRGNSYCLSVNNLCVSKVETNKVSLLIILLLSMRTVLIQPRNPTAGHTHRGNQNWKRHVYPNVHRSTVYNSQDMEAT